MLKHLLLRLSMFLERRMLVFLKHLVSSLLCSLRRWRRQCLVGYDWGFSWINASWSGTKAESLLFFSLLELVLYFILLFPVILSLLYPPFLTAVDGCRTDEGTRLFYTSA